MKQKLEKAWLQNFSQSIQSENKALIQQFINRIELLYPNGELDVNAWQRDKAELNAMSATIRKLLEEEKRRKQIIVQNYFIDAEFSKLLEVQMFLAKIYPRNLVTVDGNSICPLSGNRIAPGHSITTSSGYEFDIYAFYHHNGFKNTDPITSEKYNDLEYKTIKNSLEVISLNKQKHEILPYYSEANLKLMERSKSELISLNFSGKDRYHIGGIGLVVVGAIIGGFATGLVALPAIALGLFAAIGLGLGIASLASHYIRKKSLNALNAEYEKIEKASVLEKNNSPNPAKIFSSVPQFSPTHLKSDLCQEVIAANPNKIESEYPQNRSLSLKR